MSACDGGPEKGGSLRPGLCGGLGLKEGIFGGWLMVRCVGRVCWAEQR